MPNRDFPRCSLSMFCLLLPASCVFGSAAWADDNKTAVAVEEVIVTAQRRAQTLQEVPMAISVIGGAELEKARVANVQDLAGFVPNFNYAEFNASDPKVTIRGIGSGFDSAALERSVALFVDDVYIGRAAGGTADIFDLERVEVLRGPQGTLFGKNTVGGAINLISKRPSSETYALAEISVGNEGLFETKLIGNKALSSTVNGRVSFRSRYHDGYATDLTSGEPLDDLESYAIRASLSIAPNDEMDILLSADAYSRNSNGINRHITDPGPLFANAVGPEPRKNYLRFPGYQENATWGIGAHIDWSREWGKVSSITAVRGSRSKIMFDYIGAVIDRADPSNSPFFDVWNKIEEEATQYSQELRFTRDSDGPFNWVVGAFYYREDVPRVERTDIELLPNPSTVFVSHDTKSKAASYALFADATYQVSDKFEVAAGVRETWDNKDYVLDASGTRYASLPFGTVESKSWNELTPRLIATYYANEDAMIYGTVAKGFKSGGWGGQPVSLVEAIIPVNPETVINYELGSKMTILDHRMTLNLAMFYMDYKDLQAMTTTTPPGGGVPLTAMINAGDAEVSGIEADVTWLIAEGLTVSGTYGYLDTEITSSFEIGGVDVKGHSLITPDTTFSVNATYETPVSSSLNLSIYAGYRFSGDYWKTFNYDPDTFVDSYGIVDGHVALATSDGKWEASLWGKNLGDTLYPENILTAFDTGFTAYAPPRTYGISVRWNTN